MCLILNVQLLSKLTQQPRTWCFHLCFKSASEILHTQNQVPDCPFPPSHPSYSFPLSLKAIPFSQLLGESSWSYHRLLFSYTLYTVRKSYQLYFSNRSKVWSPLTVPGQSIIIAQPNYCNKFWNCSNLLNKFLLPSHPFSTKVKIIHFKYVRWCFSSSQIPLDFP